MGQPPEDDNRDKEPEDREEPEERDEREESEPREDSGEPEGPRDYEERYPLEDEEEDGAPEDEEPGEEDTPAPSQEGRPGEGIPYDEDYYDEPDEYEEGYAYDGEEPEDIHEHGEQPDPYEDRAEHEEPQPGGAGGDDEDYGYDEYMEEDEDFGYEDFDEGPGPIMPLGDHLEELRSRIILSLVVLAVAFIVAWLFNDRIMSVVKRPHELATAAMQLEQSLKFGSYTEPVVSKLKACLIAAALVVAPFLLYQAWAFIAPGLFHHERKHVVKLMFPSFLCLAVGVCFGYFLFIPLALRFLLSLSGAGTEPVLMIGSYLSLFFLLTLALGIAFQTPLVMYLLVKWEIVDVDAIQEHRKVAMVAAFALAAFLTPPDPATQCMMAIPLVMLYDIGALAGAPSRKAFVNFMKFAGTILLIIGAIAAWYFLWPVGKLTMVKGSAALGDRNIQGEETVSLRRGTILELSKGSVGRFWSGKQASGPSIYMRDESKVQVHAPLKASFYSGRILAVCTDSSEPMDIRTPIVRTSLEGARAEMTYLDPDSVKIIVAEGKVTASWEGQDRVITAGHEDTFRRGGEPTDTKDIEERWKDLLGAEEKQPEKEAAPEKKPDDSGEKPKGEEEKDQPAPGQPTEQEEWPETQK